MPDPVPPDPAPPDPPRVELSRRLASTDVRAVLALAEAAADVDGAHPLGEHVLLHLRHGGDEGSLHLLVRDPRHGALLGYGHLDTTDPVDGPSAEIAVSPAARRRGVGRALIEAMIAHGGPEAGRLRLWAHGTDASAGRLASAAGFHLVRRLWQMRRSLLAPLDPVRLPPDVSLRAFDPGRDPDAWLDLNARTFVALPDQAGWTRRDLDRRMAEAWFDPAGFLVAHDAAGAMVGFHWTKVHGGDTGGHAHDDLGEVYVVGVDPARRGQGLGRALTLAGLHHLRHAGARSALLYVDERNHPAIGLYRSLGFTPWDSDTLFRR